MGSVLVTVALSGERCLKVASPLSQACSGRRRKRLLLVGLVAFDVAFNAMKFFEFTTRVDQVNGTTVAEIAVTGELGGIEAKKCLAHLAPQPTPP